jgi:hypothetical protein
MPFFSHARLDAEALQILWQLHGPASALRRQRAQPCTQTPRLKPGQHAEALRETYAAAATSRSVRSVHSSLNSKRSALTCQCSFAAWKSKNVLLQTKTSCHVTSFWYFNLLIANSFADAGTVRGATEASAAALNTPNFSASAMRTALGAGAGRGSRIVCMSNIAQNCSTFQPAPQESS